MSYVDKNLMPGEQVVYRARIHWICIASPVFWIAFWGVLWFKVAPLFLVFVATNIPNDGRAVATLTAINVVVTLVFGVVVFRLVWGLLLNLIAFVSSEFAVTDKRVLAKFGALRQISLELFLSQVEGTIVGQSILGRILGYGTLTVTGTGGMKTPFPNIAHADEYRQQIRGHIIT